MGYQLMSSRSYALVVVTSGQHKRIYQHLGCHRVGFIESIDTYNRYCLEFAWKQSRPLHVGNKVIEHLFFDFEQMSLSIPLKSR